MKTFAAWFLGTLGSFVVLPTVQAIEMDKDTRFPIFPIVTVYKPLKHSNIYTTGKKGLGKLQWCGEYFVAFLSGNEPDGYFMPNIGFAYNRMKNDRQVRDDAVMLPQMIGVYVLPDIKRPFVVEVIASHIHWSVYLSPLQLKQARCLPRGNPV